MENFVYQYLDILQNIQNYNDITYIEENKQVNKIVHLHECIFWLEIHYPYQFSHQIISNKNLFNDVRKNGYLNGNTKNILKDEENDEYILYNGNKVYIINDNPDSLMWTLILLYIEMHKNSPHNYGNYISYLHNKIKPNKKNIVVDCGSSEGIFEILVANNYDISDILFVCIDPETQWNHPLSKTLNELGANYIIVNEYINEENTLANILEKNNLDPNDVICIKADIEGAEIDLINGFVNYLNNNPLCIICTYHNQDDAIDLYNIFENYYKNIEFSKGYLLPLIGELKYPYYRKALIITH